MIEVLARIERGELASIEEVGDDNPHGIDMARYFTEIGDKQKEDWSMMDRLYSYFLPKQECGTIGCVAGWAYLLSNGKAFPELNPFRKSNYNTDALLFRFQHDNEYHELLNGVFGINQNWYKYDTSTEAIGTRLRNFLTTGKCN